MICLAYGVNPLSLQSVVVAGARQVSCDLAGEAAILHLGSGTYYGLDPVGTRIWALEVAPDRLEADLFDLLTRLAAERLIEVRDADAA